MPATVSGVPVEFLLDTGARDVAIPPALARRLKLRRGPEVEIVTASDVIAGYLVTLDEVSIGPLTLMRVTLARIDADPPEIERFEVTDR